MALFDPLWIRYPVDLATQSFQTPAYARGASPAV